MTGMCAFLPNVPVKDEYLIITSIMSIICPKTFWLLGYSCLIDKIYFWFVFIIVNYFNLIKEIVKIIVILDTNPDSATYIWTLDATATTNVISGKSADHENSTYDSMTNESNEQGHIIHIIKSYPSSHSIFITLKLPKLQAWYH